MKEFNPKVQVTREAANFSQTEQRRSIGWGLDASKNSLSGDVRKLTAKTQEYRLRVGSLRVLFTPEKDLMTISSWKAKNATGCISRSTASTAP